MKLKGLKNLKGQKIENWKEFNKRKERKSCNLFTNEAKRA